VTDTSEEIRRRFSESRKTPAGTLTVSAPYVGLL